MESNSGVIEAAEVKKEILDPEFEPVAVKVEIDDDGYNTGSSRLCNETPKENNTAVGECRNREQCPPATSEKSQSSEIPNGPNVNEENGQPSDQTEIRKVDESKKCERKVLTKSKRKNKPVSSTLHKVNSVAKSRKQVNNGLEQRNENHIDENGKQDKINDKMKKVKNERRDKSGQKRAQNVARDKRGRKKEPSAVCKTCNKKFTRLSSMLRHRRRSKCSPTEKPPDDGTAYIKNLQKKISLQSTCNVCNRVLSSPANLKRHFDALHGDGIRAAENLNVVCAFEGCTKKFNLPSSMRKHYDAVHMNIRKFLCDICSDMFKNISALKMHMKACHAKEGEMYECSVCKRQFSTKFKLTSHETVHTNIKPYSCEYEGCGKVFRLKDSLKKHLKTHQNYRPHVCTICNQAFSRKMYLETHQYKHTGIKMFKCSVCEKTFSQKGNLYVHMKSHGDQHAPFRCKLCSKAYTTRDGLKQHKITTHRIYSVDPEEHVDVLGMA